MKYPKQTGNGFISVTEALYRNRNLCQPPKKTCTKCFLIAHAVVRGRVCHLANTHVGHALSTGTGSPPVLEREAHLAGLSCEPRPVQPQPSSPPRAGVHLLKVVSARALPAQPCRLSGNAYAPVRHFFQGFKGSKFHPK